LGHRKFLFMERNQLRSIQRPAPDKTTALRWFAVWVSFYFIGDLVWQIAVTKGIFDERFSHPYYLWNFANYIFLLLFLGKVRLRFWTLAPVYLVAIADFGLQTASAISGISVNGKLFAGISYIILVASCLIQFLISIIKKWQKAK